MERVFREGGWALGWSELVAVGWVMGWSKFVGGWVGLGME